MNLIKKNLSIFLIFLLFSSHSFLKAEEEEILIQSISDQIQVLTKDLKTLEKAVYKKSGSSSLVGDVYTGKETVKFLASGVPDRVFFATNKSSLTTASRATLRKQATYLRKNKKLNVTIEGHADERGTREYNLALGERRANAAKDYLTVSYTHLTLPTILLV